VKAIIVDGGKATRLGVEPPKGLVDINGLPLIGLLLRRFDGLGIKDVTLITSIECAEAYEKSEYRRALNIVIDKRMTGPLAAIYQVAAHFRDEDVIITTGDAFFANLNSLRGCAPGYVLPLVDAPRARTFHIALDSSSNARVSRSIQADGFSYASAIRVCRCSGFWTGVRHTLMEGCTSIIQALAWESFSDIELRMVNGFWRNVNEPSDLVAVKDYLGPH